MPLREKRPLDRRRWLVGLMGMTLALWSRLACAEDSAQTVSLKVGDATTIALMENPSTGYRWRLNAEASRNLAAVAVEDAGFTRPATGAPPIGAPGERVFRITAQRPGRAVAVFEYARPWEQGAPARIDRFAIDVAAR